MSTEQRGGPRTVFDDEALVQCRLCCWHEAQPVETGQAEDIRCSQCGGAVEVLTINGEPV